MSLIWQDVAGGLPAPELPMPPDGWGTRFFAAALVLSDGQVERLRSVAQSLLAGGLTVLLPHGAGTDGAGTDGAGPDWPCRLLAAPDLVLMPDGQWHARLEFAVVVSAESGPDAQEPEAQEPETQELEAG